MKIEMSISTEVEKTVWDTVGIFASQWRKAKRAKNKIASLSTYEAFIAYIDMLYDAGKITDNQYTFLELWFMWDGIENDSNID